MNIVGSCSTAPFSLGMAFKDMRRAFLQHYSAKRNLVGLSVFNSLAFVSEKLEEVANERLNVGLLIKSFGQLESDGK